MTSLTLMGVATFAIGLVPTYERIGIAAPVTLCVLRFVQGFALGGEWSGAVTLAMEHAPERRRGWWTAWVQYGALGGIVLSTGTVLVLSATLSDRQFGTWGWRVPFLASGILLAVGLFVRLRIEESPVFRELEAQGAKSRVPAVEALRDHWWTVLRVCGMHLVVTAFATTLMTFYVSYGVARVGFTRTEMLQVVFAATAITAVVAPFTGNLSDRFGRRRIYVLGCALSTAGVFPSFVLLNTGGQLLGIAGILCLVVPLSVTYQVQGAYFTELFPPRSRVTGAGFGAQLATVAVGGPAPIIAQALLQKGDGEPWGVATYLCAVALVSLVSAALTPDKRPSDQLARWDAAKAGRTDALEAEHAFAERV